MKRAYDGDVIGTRPVRIETADLPLFTNTPRTVAVAGAGQQARAKARAKSDAVTGRMTVLRALEAHPLGLTRWEIHHITGLPINTVNARVAQLRDETKAHTRGVRTTPDNLGQPIEGSVVHYGPIAQDSN
jgi:hypothetical protein